MFVNRIKSGFSSLEVIVAVAILLILASMVLGVGKRIRQQANERLAQSLIDVLVTALEQYYTDTSRFPPSDIDVDPDIGTITSGSNLPVYESSEILFYYLNSHPNSKRIVSAISDMLITGKDAAGADLLIDIGGTPTDLLRYIGPWSKNKAVPNGNVLEYETYNPNPPYDPYTFPVLEIETPTGGIISNR